MDFEIPEELKEFIDGVRRFREREMMPLEREFLLNGDWDLQTRLALEEKARKAGFWALDVPVEDGGQGMDEFAMCLVAEELYKHPAMFEFGGSPEPALRLCNEEQKKRYYYPVIAGERRSAYAFTEPDTGSDFARIRTTAVRDGDEWVINGRKTFISHVDRADFLILFASTDPSAGARGVTCFLVDKSTPGFEVSRPIPTMGDGWTPYELSFNNCRVPHENVLGEVNKGFAIADLQLTHGRIRIGAYQLGIAQRCLELAIDWAKKRHTWGKPIATRQAIQWMIADSHVELEAARMLVYRAAKSYGTERARHEAFVAKLYATEMAQRVTDRCLQIFGGLGYTKELPIQSFYRQVRVWRIGHGTAEVHRWMIARRLLGLKSDS
ncbi:MAG: acyl-CoA dehydrogenase family protein [Micromonosporaceae bacterium]|jgi:acyl-CoA dehydrogenase